METKSSRVKRIIVLLLKLVAIEECLFHIISHYYIEVNAFSISPSFIISLLALVTLSWYTKNFQKKNYFKPTHIPLIFALLFLAIHFRAGILWAFNIFPLKDAGAVLLTLQEPFDDLAYSMVRQYLATTIPQALVATIFLTIFLYALFSRTRNRLIAIAIYFISTLVILCHDLPLSDYFHILNDNPEKSASYSKFFAENYANPDSVTITTPNQKRNLILIYLESLETTFADKEHGGFQEENLIPELTELALHNTSFGNGRNQIGGGLDATGSNHTFGSFHTRTLGIPIVKFVKTPILHQYSSLYKFLNKQGYKQIFFQGNPGLFEQFQNFAIEQQIDEIYNPDDLIQQLNLNIEDLIRKQGYKTVQDRDAFRFAQQILDTIAEPFSLTFFTIDTHGPNGMYDPDCIKISNESDKEEQHRATARCVSKELDRFLTSLKSKPFYENTSIVIFGDHLLMGTSLVKGFSNRKWVNVFVNPSKSPISEKNRLFTDIDMFPTILSSMNFDIERDRLGLGTDLFSDKKTLVEKIGLDSLNKEFQNIPSHLIYESYLHKKKSK